MRSKENCVPSCLGSDVCVSQCFQSCQQVAGFPDSGSFLAPARRWRAMAGAGEEGEQAGAEVTGGNWCDDHVWPPLPPLHHHQHHQHTCATNMEHASPPQPRSTLACVANAWKRADSVWRPQSPESRRELSHIALCRQTVRSEITFTLQDILLNPL